MGLSSMWNLFDNSSVDSVPHIYRYPILFFVTILGLWLLWKVWINRSQPRSTRIRKIDASQVGLPQ